MQEDPPTADAVSAEIEFRQAELVFNLGTRVPFRHRGMYDLAR